MIRNNFQIIKSFMSGRMKKMQVVAGPSMKSMCKLYVDDFYKNPKEYGKF